MLSFCCEDEKKLFKVTLITIEVEFVSIKKNSATNRTNKPKAYYTVKLKVYQTIYNLFYSKMITIVNKINLSTLQTFKFVLFK